MGPWNRPISKSSGEYPIVGVNTFTNPHADVEKEMDELEVRRGSEDEKQNQLRRLAEFKETHSAESGPALERLRAVALSNGNVFEELMEAVKTCSLGQISQALFEVGGQYRRNT